MEADPVQRRLDYNDSLFWFTGSPEARGLLIRTVIFSILAGIQAVASVVRWVIYAVELRRRRERVWLWRFVELPSGRFFILNQVLCGTITVFWTGVTFATYYALFYRMFALDGRRDFLGTLSSTIYVPLSINGWLMGWSIIQANLIVMESKVRWAAKWARIAAWVFFATTPLVVLAVVFMPAAAARSWAHVIAQYKLARAMMVAALAEGTSRNAAVVAAVDKAADRVRTLVLSHDATQTAINVMYAVLAVGKAVLGLAAISIYLVVRRQLHESARDILFEPDLDLNTNPDLDLPTGPHPASDSPMIRAHHTTPTKPPLDSKNSLNVLISLSPTAPPRSFLRAPPRSPALTLDPSPSPSPLPQNIRDLQYAKAKVAIVGLNTVVSGLAFAAVFGWAAPVPTLHLHGTTWAAREAASFLVAAVWSVLFTPMSVGLTWKAYRQLPPKEVPGTVMPDEDELDGFVGVGVERGEVMSGGRV